MILAVKAAGAVQRFCPHCADFIFISMAGRTVPIRVRGRIVAIRARDATRAIVVKIARTPRRVQARTTGGIESRRTPLYHSIRNIAYRIM
jgi:hypothetical protein